MDSHRVARIIGSFGHHVGRGGAYTRGGKSNPLPMHMTFQFAHSLLMCPSHPRVKANRGWKECQGLDFGIAAEGFGKGSLNLPG